MLGPHDRYGNKRCACHPRQPGSSPLRWVLTPPLDPAPFREQAHGTATFEMVDRFAHGPDRVPVPIEGNSPEELKETLESSRLREKVINGEETHVTIEIHADQRRVKMREVVRSDHHRSVVREMLRTGHLQIEECSRDHPVRQPKKPVECPRRRSYEIRHRCRDQGTGPRERGSDAGWRGANRSCRVRERRSEPRFQS